MRKSSSKKIVAEGSRLAYSAKDMIEYRKRLRKLIDQMTKEVTQQVLKLFRSDMAEEFIENQELLEALDTSKGGCKMYLSTAPLVSFDESISSQARILLNKLTRKFNKLFSEKSSPYSEDMVKGQIRASNISLKRSLKEMSADVTLSSKFIPNNIKEIATASIAENVSLIKSIPSEYMQKVQGSVMRAITSGGDIHQLKYALSKQKAISDRRVKNMADDQVRKAYNSVNKQRMMNVGVTKFMWLHSGGGQKPRQDHINMNGNIYSFDDLPVIDKNTGETGIPGQAINCGCTMKPVFELDDD